MNPIAIASIYQNVPQDHKKNFVVRSEFNQSQDYFEDKINPVRIFISYLWHSGKKDSSIDIKNDTSIASTVYLTSSGINISNGSLMSSTGISWTSVLNVETLNGVEYRNPNEISQFIIEFPSVNGYVAKAQSIIGKYFPDAKLALEVSTDHDSETGFNELFIHIKTSIPTREALSILKKINEEIFSYMGKDELLLNIDIEHI